MPIDLARAAFVHVRGALQKSATLIVNSSALAIGTATTAGFGFVYWWIAARLLPPEVIGSASALLSVMGLIGMLGEAGIGTLLMGELVRRPGREPGLVTATASIGVPLAVSVAVLFVIGEAFLMRPPGLIDGWLEGVTFAFGCGLTTLTNLGDQGFVGMLRSSGKMIRQALFSTLKLMLIAAAIAIGCTSTSMIVLTWLAGLLASWIGVDLLTRGGARRLVAPPDFQLLNTFRRKVCDHYLLDVALQAPTVIMPYLVMILLSPTTNAAFVPLWLVVSVISFIPSAMATVLFPVVRASPQQSAHDILVSLAASLLFSLICSIFIFTYSQEILAVFNPAYPGIAGSSLRFLGFSLLGSTLKSHACTLARLGDRMRKASRWFALGGLLELSFTICGAKLSGLEGLVLGWTLAVSIEGACGALVLAFAMKSNSAIAPVHEASSVSPLRTEVVNLALGNDLNS